MCCYKHCHGNAVKEFLLCICWLAGWRSFAVKRVWALWDNIYDYVCVFFYIFPCILDEKFTSNHLDNILCTVF
jgi:hypothetical protein